MMTYRIKNLYNHEPKVIVVNDDGIVYEIEESTPEYADVLNELMKGHYDVVREMLTRDAEFMDWVENP